MNFAYWSSCVFTDSSTRAWTVTDFGCLGGALMIAMPSFYSSFTVLSHMPSYKFADSPPLPDQKTRCAFQQQVSLSYPLHWLPPDSLCSPRHHTPSFAACFPLVVWSDRHGFRGNEVGSLQTTSVDYARPNCASRRAQPLCSQQFRLAPG